MSFLSRTPILRFITLKVIQIKNLFFACLMAAKPFFRRHKELTFSVLCRPFLCFKRKKRIQNFYVSVFEKRRLFFKFALKNFGIQVFLLLFFNFWKFAKTLKSVFCFLSASVLIFTLLFCHLKYCLTFLNLKSEFNRVSVAFECLERIGTGALCRAWFNLKRCRVQCGLLNQHLFKQSDCLTFFICLPPLHSQSFSLNCFYRASRSKPPAFDIANWTALSSLPTAAFRYRRPDTHGFFLLIETY